MMSEERPAIPDDVQSELWKTGRGNDRAPSRRASSTAWRMRRSPIFRPPPSRICGGSRCFTQSRGVPHISISPGINEMGPEVAAYIHAPNTAPVVLGTDGLSGQRRSRLLVLFIAGNIITAVGPSYPIALVGRVITSLTHGRFSA